jgi:hypothetical protein
MPKSAANSPAEREYVLQLQHALLRTMATVLQSSEDATASEHIAVELRELECELDRLPTSQRPMLALARRFGWSHLETDFVWVTTALAADPRLLVHARALDPVAVQGMSTALYSRIARLDSADAQAIGGALLPRSGLLVRSPGSWLPTSTP